MLTPYTIKTSNGALLKAVVICDDIEFAIRAEDMLRYVGRRSGVGVEWEVRCWPANALTENALAEEIRLESLDAHMIVLPVRQAHAVDPGVLQWLKKWAQDRHVLDAGLAFIGEQTSRPPREDSSTRAVGTADQFPKWIFPAATTRR